MAIPYRTAKLKSANIFVMSIWDQTANLIPANISGYTVIFMLSLKLMCPPMQCVGVMYFCVQHLFLLACHVGMNSKGFKLNQLAG